MLDARLLAQRITSSAKVYHRTNPAAVEAIIAHGFEDRGDFLTRSVRAEGGV
jgi:hypothetical protein